MIKTKIDWSPKGEIYKKICSICRESFESKYKNKQVCSFDCKKEKIRRVSREMMRRRRYDSKRWKPCQVCGYKETTDIHHEGKQTYILCPNHHALITRGIKTINQLLPKAIIKTSRTSEVPHYTAEKTALDGTVIEK